MIIFMALTLAAEKIPPRERSVIPAQELIDPNIQHFIAAAEFQHVSGIFFLCRF